MGISVFAGAIDQLKGVDIAYDGYVNEFILGKKRIIVKPEATKTVDGKPIFDARETVYYSLPEDSTNGSIMQQVDMTLRTAEFNAGIQDMLNVLSSKCGFGENHYKYDNGNVSTATQVVSENSSLFRTIKKHELIVETVLIDLCRIILRMGNKYMGMNLDEDVEISIDFDDSIIEDEESNFNRDARLLQMGIMNDWEFRAKWMNEDPETAKKSLPRMEAMTTEGQDDVE
jgi:A118 family predicted phage portal protein